MVQDPWRNAHKKYVSAHVLFRLLAGAATLAAALVMGFNKETKNIAGFQMVATYKTSPVFEFFLVGNAITCGYSIASLPFVSKLVESYILDLLDLVNLVLVMASASAATAIGYLGKEGNDQIGWMKVCPYYEKFCNRVAVSLACSYVGLLFFLLICALSSVFKTRLSKNA